jgi:lipopolysaccharide biosynthesis regulator YciM
VTLEQLHRLLALAGLAALVALGFAVSRHRRRRREAQSVLRGVRSMLSDDPDAAIAALSDAARLGTAQARETYLALGALLRRTGDLARAVRLHRNMLAAGRLPDSARAEVERELAEDYRRSGMLEEAGDLLRPLAAGDREAARALREVLADQSRWREAAEVQARLAEPGPDPVRAQLWAAAARAELRSGESAAAPGTGPEAPPAAARERARQAVAAALAADPAGAAGQLTLAEVEATAGRSTEALAALRAGLDADPRLGVLAWGALARQPDREAALASLAELSSAHPAEASLPMLAGRLLYRAGRTAEALAALRTALTLDRSGAVTLALRDLLRQDGQATRSADPGELEARNELLLLALRHRAAGVPCRRCGVEAPAPAWRCRACGALGGPV